MHTKSGACLDHPLGILCSCNKYKNIGQNFRIYAPGTYYYRELEGNVKKLDAERVKLMRNDSKSTDDIEKLWMPVIPDLVSFKHIEV